MGIHQLTASALPQEGVRWRRCVRPAAVAVGAATGLAYLGVVDPSEPGHYPTCPFLLVTGHFCAGCGSLRALHAIVHGDVLAAVGLNVLTVAFVPVLAWIWWQWLRRQALGQPRRTLAPAWRLWALLVVVVAFWVARNLPPFAALAP